jgi:hypothetical protein
MSSRTTSILLVLATAAAGCGHAAEPLRLRATDFKSWPALEAAGRPIVLEFREGDRIPVDFSIDGDLVQTLPAAPEIALRARKPFFVRVSADGLAVSADGVHFDEEPMTRGSFAFGLSVTRERGPEVEVHIKTPTQAAAGEAGRKTPQR